MYYSKPIFNNLRNNNKYFIMRHTMHNGHEERVWKVVWKERRGGRQMEYVRRAREDRVAVDRTEVLSSKYIYSVLRRTHVTEDN